MAKMAIDVSAGIDYFSLNYFQERLLSRAHQLAYSSRRCAGGFKYMMAPLDNGMD